MASESAYETIRRIEDFYTSQINQLIETGQEEKVADLTATFAEDLRVALDRAA